MWYISICMLYAGLQYHINTILWANMLYIYIYLLIPSQNFDPLVLLFLLILIVCISNNIYNNVPNTHIVTKYYTLTVEKFDE